MPTDRHRPKPRLRRALAFGLAALLSASQLLACATAGVQKDRGAPGVPTGPSADPSDPEHATAEEAEAFFDAAEQDLQQLMVTSVEKSADDEDPDALADEGADGPAPAPPSTRQEREYAASSKAARCDRACVALGSMQRSAARLCELTGEEDARCQSVRLRVESAEELVRRFCPRCPS